MFGSEQDSLPCCLCAGQGSGRIPGCGVSGCCAQGLLCSPCSSSTALRGCRQRRLCSAGTFWESTGHSPALLRWRCQCKNSLIWSASLRDPVGIFVLVVLGLNRGKDPTEAMKKSCGNRRGALGSGGGRGAPSWGLRPSRGLALHLSAVRTAAALVPQVGEAGRRKRRDPRGPQEAAGRPAAAPRPQAMAARPGTAASPCGASASSGPRPRGGALRPLPPGSPCPSPKMAASEGKPEGGGGRRAGA